jgi:general secretion pathway protein L
MESSTTALRQGASDFMGWWFGELSALVPTQLKQSLKAADRIIAVTIDESRITLVKIENCIADTLVQVGTKSAGLDTSQQELGRLISKYPAGKWRWGLYLDNNAILGDRLLLPIAAKENFYEAVEFQVDRQTPFQRQEIYFDCCPNDAQSTNRTLCVDYIIAPLERVDSAINFLTSIGVRIDFITSTAELSGEPPRFNFLSNRGKPQRRPGRKLNAYLATLTVLLAGATTYLTLDNDRRQAKVLSAQVEILRDKARLASQLQSTIASEKRSVNHVLDLKRQTQPVIQILTNLTRLLPDDSWVSRFTYKDETIQVVVHAPESSSIVRLVEGSGQFTGAKMMTAVRKVKDENKERFTISFSTRSKATP